MSFKDLGRHDGPGDPPRLAAQELVCDRCGNADTTPEAHYGIVCWRMGCGGRLRWQPHRERT